MRKLKLSHFFKIILLNISHLCNRKQIIKCSIASPDHLRVTAGVSQGWVLVPLLFIFYVNELVWAAFQSTTDTRVFADDYAA